MPLADVFKDFAAELPPEVAFVGPDDVEMNHAPNRITWEPISARHSPPKRISRGANDEGDLWQREVSVNVQIWGQTHTETEGLLVTFVNATHRLLGGPGYQLAGEEWSRGGPESAGFQVKLTLVVFQPLRRELQPSRPVTAINPVFKLDGQAV